MGRSVCFLPPHPAAVPPTSPASGEVKPLCFLPPQPAASPSGPAAARRGHLSPTSGEGDADLPGERGGETSLLPTAPPGGVLIRPGRCAAGPPSPASGEGSADLPGERGGEASLLYLAVGSHSARVFSYVAISVLWRST